MANIRLQEKSFHSQPSLVEIRTLKPSAFARRVYKKERPENSGALSPDLQVLKPFKEPDRPFKPLGPNRDTRAHTRTHTHRHTRGRTHASKAQESQASPSPKTLDHKP